MLRIKIDWYALRRIAKQHPTIYAQLAECMHAWGEHPAPSIDDVLADKVYREFDGFINTHEELPDELVEFVKYYPIRALKVFANNRENISGTGIREAMRACQVHLPGNELLRIDRVQVLEDACTDALQKELNEGYRIVAVIPRAGQRRPDYVLGKRE